MFDNVAVRITAGIVLGGIILILVLWLLPTYPLPDQGKEAIEWVFSTLWSFNFMIPVRTLVFLFGLIITIEIAFLSIHLVLWLKKVFVKSAP